MNFAKRLRYYAIGLMMGLVVSFMFFKNRGCGWLPGNRVMDAISSSYIVRTDSMQCLMNCNAISDEDLYNIFYHGDVLFSESKVDEPEKIYVLQGIREVTQSKFKIAFKIKDTISVIHHIPDAHNTCNCVDTSDFLHPVFMPDRLVQDVFKQSEFQTTALADEEIVQLKLNQEKVKDIVFNGIIVRASSDPYSKPHPYYVVSKDNFLVRLELANKITRVLSVKEK